VDNLLSNQLAVHRNTQKFTTEGIHKGGSGSFYKGGWPGGLGDRSPPAGYRGKAPIEDPVDEVPQKLEISVQFLTFSV